ncbi:MAG TPA: hypothetical protein PKY77_00520 [Phycisphaerae bacterium]|nr:hypothetical protein [Phycisphaerae bacterium]HRY67663.1 hypothetical protein [Phycisphaerae bacterium]HSA25050.1 hypothetical protein [Phycisphaerae bacterium]
MKTTSRAAIRGLCLLALAMVFSALLTGCGKKDEEPKVGTRSGKVASYDKATGVVQMKVFDPDRKEEVTVPGILGPQVEVIINGAVATLDDVRIDDKVKVTGTKVKEDGKRKFIVKKVEVERPMADTQPSSASAPASSADGK